MKTMTTTCPTACAPWRRLLVAMTIAAVAVTGCATAEGSNEERLSAAEAGFDSATRDDAEFNETFTHRFTEVDDVRMHYVVGGTGPALVLLHGWPQSWYEWRGIMPELARDYIVYALDIPGLGDSEGAPSSYDKATLADYVHGLLVDELDLDDIRLVAHDLGAGIGFQYTAQYPDHVARYVHMDYPLPGPALPAAQYRTFSWHLAFHDQEGIPEKLVDDEVRDYLASFYPQVAYGGLAFGGTDTESPFDEGQIDEFARTYSRPQVLTGGFELYRTLDDDERDNNAVTATTVETMLMAGEGALASLRPSVEPLMGNITAAVEVPGSGHWLPEENPEFVVRELRSFLQ